MFAPHNAYHTLNLSYAVPYLEREGVDCIFLNIDRVYKNEGVEKEAKRLGLKYVDYSANVLTRLKPDVLVCMNDWGGVVHRLVKLANRIGVTTVSIVEGVQDFEDTHVAHINVGRIRKPYQHTKYAFLVGDYDKKFLGERRTTVVGIPRIEHLYDEQPVFPKKPLVVINSNFTYGVYTGEIQKNWIESVIEACDRLQMDYVISQHHADKMNLTQYNVVHKHIHDVLKEGTLLVSKFSTCLLECMVIGKPVIYHNPHGERVDTFQDPMGAFRITRSTDDLVEAIPEAVDGKNTYRDRCQKFLNYHVSKTDEPSAQRIAKAIMALPLENKGSRFVLRLMQAAKWRGKELVRKAVGKRGLDLAKRVVGRS